MQCDLLQGDFARNRPDQLPDLLGPANANRVPERDFVGPLLEEVAAQGHDRAQVHVTFVGAAADGRNDGAHRHAIVLCALHHRSEMLELFGDAAVQVLAVVGLAGRHEDHGHVSSPGAAKTLIALLVGDQRAVGHVR